MPIVEAKEKVRTGLGVADLLVESDHPICSSGVHGSVTLTRGETDFNRSVFIRTTGDYTGASDAKPNCRGWQVALNKDQMLCLARALIKMAGELR